ncbi:MAG TPA: ribosomal protein S18-alanine N-acetyltransferase [Planctomycetaceae bacterium]|nr:ribosomal protein S18-alanine N-acetyltransferase [Planctomycetaceae bacterium]
MSYGPTQRQQQQCAVQIRWMIRRDMPEVLDIEQQSFEFAWTEEDFLCCLRQRNCIGMVAEHQERIVGFMIYELLKSQLHVLNFAVAPWARRTGIGGQMIDKLVHKLAQQRRTEIRLEVREGNLPAQMFFKSKEFAATTVLRGHYEDTAEDAYVMRYVLDQTADAITPYAPKNRISEYEDA